ncbi:MAG: acyl-CoA dehydrogenase family protein [Chromatiales bacterium]|nr:acyl-CoA dehydrogenase family protein [Chromatiales bacterium]
MNFSLNEEQRLLKDSAERFVRENCSLDRRRALVAGEPGYSERSWRQMAELGWLGVGVPEAFGGTAGGPVETMVLMEAFGAGLLVEPYFPSVVLGTGLVTEAGTEAQKEAILPAAVAGELKLAFAWVEARSGFDLFDVRTTARRGDGGWVLDGAKGVVLGAAAADRLIVSARTSGGPRDRYGIGLFLVDREAEGVRLRDYRTVDGLRAAEVAFENVTVGDDAVLGDPRDALPAVEAVAERAIAALCAEAVGVMDVIVRDTAEYLKTRKQFGRPIGAFQVLQHQFTDMLIASEEARSMTYVATLRLGECDAVARTKAVSGTKHLVGRNGRLIGQRAIQLHGGMGMTEEMAVGHYFKRLAMIDVMFGDAAYHLKRYASL